MCVRQITTHKGPVTFQPSSTSLGLKRDYLGGLVLLFMLRITVKSKSRPCFPSSDEQCFQLSAILAGQKNYFMTLFANRALTLFVFWSGLPLASNGLPSTHKSHSYNPSDFSFPRHALFGVPCLCSRKAIFCHKSSHTMLAFSFCTWEHAFFLNRD